MAPPPGGLECILQVGASLVPGVVCLLGFCVLLQSPVSTPENGNPILVRTFPGPSFCPARQSYRDLSFTCPEPAYAWPPCQRLRTNSPVSPDSLYQNPTSHEAPRLPGTARNSCTVSSSHWRVMVKLSMQGLGWGPCRSVGLEQSHPSPASPLGDLSLGQPGLAPTPDQKTTGTCAHALGLA